MNRLTTVTYDGVVADVEIVGDYGRKNLNKLICDSIIRFSVHQVNPDSHYVIYQNVYTEHPISKFKAVYLNGIRLVTNGELTP